MTTSSIDSTVQRIGERRPKLGQHDEFERAAVTADAVLDTVRLQILVIHLEGCVAYRGLNPCESFGQRAQIVTPGCGVCQPRVGFLSDGETCITSTTRNFKGRKGSMNAEIFLGGPLTVAAAALAGEIVHPKEVLRGV